MGNAIDGTVFLDVLDCNCIDASANDYLRARVTFGLGENLGRGEITMWNSPAEFFAMGGYALYVWCSFGVCALILVLEPLVINRRRKVIVSRLKREIRAEKFDKEGMK